MLNSIVTDQMLERFSCQLPLPWAKNFAAAAATAEEILQFLTTDRRLLGELVEDSWHDQRLREMAERFDRIDRLVLFDNLEIGIRLRLHVYPQRHIDGPHDHRWSFSTLILAGSYTHQIYERRGVFDESTEMNALAPRFVQRLQSGARYSMHHSLIHSVNADPNTVSLMLRGPAEKESLMMTDLANGMLRWKLGVHQESESELSGRKVSDQYYRKLLKHLVTQRVIDR